HGAYAAALGGTDRRQRSGERILIRGHELGAADDAGKPDSRRAGLAEVRVALAARAERLHVLEMKSAHFVPFGFTVALPRSLAISSFHSCAPSSGVVGVVVSDTALSPKTR